MFTYPTIHSLAQYITSQSKEESVTQSHSNRAKQRSSLQASREENRQFRQRRRRN